MVAAGEEDQAGESQPLVGGRKRATTHLESYGSWRVKTWTPELSRRHAAQWWVVVVSAFANIAPAGCLVVSRPAGGILPSLLSFAFFGGLSLFGAHNYAVALSISGCNTLPEIWKQCIGRWTAFIPMLTVAFTCFACCVGYANFYGHLLARVWPWNPLSGLVSSSECFYVYATAVMPMSMLVCLRDISVMRFSTAIAGLACCLVPIIAAIRYFDGSYTEDGRWGLHSTLGESHPKLSDLISFHELPSRLISLHAVLFLFHFNAVKYFRELEMPKVDRYMWGVGSAVSLGYVVVSCSMIFVFLTFGHQTMMLTMDNYNKQDTLANVARVSISVGLIGCFPLLFSGMREALVEFLNDLLPGFACISATVIFQNMFSLLLLVIVVFVTNASNRLDLLLINIGRCCCGSLLMFTIPGLVYLAAAQKHMTWSNLSMPHVFLTVVVAVLGLTVCITSAVIWSWTCLYGDTQ